MTDDKEKTVTKGMLDEALDEVVQTILTGMDNLFQKHEERFNGIDKKFEGIDKRFDGIDKRLDKIEADVYFMKQDVKDIKEELADTPTRREFKSLKLKVDSLAS